MIAVMADRMFGFQVGRRQWWGLGLTAAGLVLLAITMPRTGGSHDSFSVAAMISFQGVLLGVGGLLIIGPRAPAPTRASRRRAAAAAGVLFGVCNVAVKALSGMVGDGGVMALVSPWTAVALVGLRRRLLRLGPQPAGRRGRRGHRDHRHRGVVCCIAGGILVFGDPMPGTAIGIVGQAIAFLLVIAASALTPAPRAATGAARAPRQPAPRR